MIIIKPLLAAKLERLEDIFYPVLATPKIDGIRCIIRGGTALSRTLKPIPNVYIRNLLSKLPEGFDGEIVCPDGFQATTSAVMSADGAPPFCYRVFDWAANQPYWVRTSNLHLWSAAHKCGYVDILMPDRIVNEKAFLAYEDMVLKDGYEGVCFRSPFGSYKFGRSTLNEHHLVKFKRFSTSEARITGLVELLHNENEAHTNALGLTERSSHASAQTPGDTLGSMEVIDCKTSVAFSIGSGFTASQRDLLWQHRAWLVGKTITYKYQPTGVKEKPRFPVFLGLRPECELPFTKEPHA